MGHLQHLKKEYRALVRRLGAGTVALPEPASERARAGWREILEILYTPEEARIAARFPLRPTPLAALARRLRIREAELAPRLDAMCDKGIVMDLVRPATGETKYFLSPPVVGFFEFSMMRAHDGIPKARMAAALDAYTRGDPAFAREAFGGNTTLGRALVHETSLDDAVSSDVLDFERATAIVAEARSRSVSLCYCRHKAAHMGRACDTPQETCLSFNTGADFVVRRRFGRAISKSEALDIVTAARASGLVQIGDNVVNRPAFICNCCGCCCEFLVGVHSLRLRAVNPSGFVAAVRHEKCAGCGRCARACPIAAVATRPRRVAAHRKTEFRAEVDTTACIGCGVCVDACKKGAMHMVRRTVQPDVPRSGVERVVRMALERGRLGDLLLDEANAGGSSAVARALRVVTSLPLAERILATDAIRSRFVRALVNRLGRRV